MRRILDFDPIARADGPRLSCPIPPAIHDSVATVQAHSVLWAIQMGLTTQDSPHLQALRGGRFAGLAARCYAWATTEQIQIATDWITLLFFYDDLVDTDASARDGQEEVALRRLERHLVDLMRGTSRMPPSHPFAVAAADLRRRISKHCAAGWLDRLADDVELYIEGVHWERSTEAEGTPLTLSSYRHMRPMISAVNNCVTLATSFVRPGDPRYGTSPLLQELTRVANNHISWVNDIYSLDRELRHGQRANLVVGIAEERGCSLREALDVAIEQCNAEMQTFLAIERHLHTTNQRDADDYVALLCRWIRGNIDWHDDSDRYQNRQQSVWESSPARHGEPALVSQAL